MYDKSYPYFCWFTQANIVNAVGVCNIIFCLS